jgi:hypothetical protein
MVFPQHIFICLFFFASLLRIHPGNEWVEPMNHNEGRNRTKAKKRLRKKRLLREVICTMFVFIYSLGADDT